MQKLFQIRTPMLRLLARLVVMAVVVTYPHDAAGENWAHTWGGSGDDELAGVAADRNGNVSVAAYTGSFGAGGSEVVLLKYTPSGTLVCRQTWGGSHNDVGRDVAVNPSDGSMYVAGWTESSPSGNKDVLLVKFDNNCNFIWAQSWDFGGNEGAQ